MQEVYHTVDLALAVDDLNHAAMANELAYASAIGNQFTSTTMASADFYYGMALFNVVLSAISMGEITKSVNQYKKFNSLSEEGKKVLTNSKVLERSRLLEGLSEADLNKLGKLTENQVGKISKLSNEQIVCILNNPHANDIIKQIDELPVEKFDDTAFKTIINQYDNKDIIELINDVRQSAKFKNATKYLDDILLDNGKANPSKLKEIRLALEKGEFTYDEVSEIYNTMCKLNIADAYEKELIENMNFGKYLSNMVGEAPKNMCDPHAHHILFKLGNREKQKLLVKEGQEILRKYGIDPIAGKEVLCWAPNRVVGQHDIKALQMVVDGLKKIDENNGSYERVVRFLNQMGRISSQR